MLRPLDPLDAYRQDLSAAPGADAFGDDDATWLLVATGVARLARASGLERRAARGPSKTRRVSADTERHDDQRVLDEAALAEAALRVAVERGGALDARPAAGPGQQLMERVLQTAEAMEERGALRLAYTVFEATERAFPAAAPLWRARTALLRARTARKLGAFDAAHDLYEMAARDGRRAGAPDVVVRAALGAAVLARRRGNYPEATRRYVGALRVATRAGLRELRGDAHQGLMILASVAGDTGGALLHGWHALAFVEDQPTRQAEVLGNLGAVSSDAGEYRAALGAYLGAVSRTDVTRVRLPALAGASLCAAHLEDRSRLEVLTTAVEREMARAPLPYERAQALVLLADAWARAGDDARTDNYRRAALETARAHGFHEIVLTTEAALERRDERRAAAGGVETPSVEATASMAVTAAGGPAPARRDARAVLRALEALAVGSPDAPDTPWSR